VIWRPRPASELASRRASCSLGGTQARARACCAEASLQAGAGIGQGVLAACVRDARALCRRSALGRGWASLRVCPPVAAPSDMAIRFLLRRGCVCQWPGSPLGSPCCVWRRPCSRQAIAYSAPLRPGTVVAARPLSAASGSGATRRADRQRRQRLGCSAAGWALAAMARSLVRGAAHRRVGPAVRDDAACGWRAGGGSAAACPRRRARCRRAVGPRQGFSTESFLEGFRKTAHSGVPP